MPNADIYMLDSGNPIKNGSIVLGDGSKSPYYQTNDVDVNNNPTIGQIEFKYDQRFKNYRYYSGDTED